MKKIILLFVLLAIILNITACKDSTSVKGKNDTQTLVETKTEYDTDYEKIRDGLNNTHTKLKSDKKLNVAYIGGSITAGAGATSHDKTAWRPLVTNWFKENFPDAEINEINMGIGSVGSLLPVFYLEDYVISEKPDLVFIETAVNDYLQHYTNDEISVYYETIIKKLLNSNPYCDIVSVYTINDVLSITDEYYQQAAAQNEIAKHYGIPSANVGRKLRKTNGLVVPKQNGEYTKRWQMFFADEVHPTDMGHKKYAEDVIYVLKSAFDLAEKNNAEYKKHTIPKQKNKQLLLDTQFIATTNLDLSKSVGWKHSDTVATKGKWGVSNNIYTDTPNNELVFEFTGENLYIASSSIPFNSKDGLYKFSVDGGEWQNIIPSGANPKPVITGLSDSNHTVHISIGGVGENAESDLYKTFIIDAFLVH